MKNVSLIIAIVAVFVFSGCSASAPKTSVSLSPNAAQSIDLGQHVVLAATVANDSSNAGATWACSGAACTTLAAVSTTSATFNATGSTGKATITATSVKTPTATASITVTVSALPAITTTQAQVTAATAGTAYSLALAATGGTGSLAWSASGLSDGLSVNTSTGAISGTPTSKATVTFTVTVTDSSSAGPQSASSPLVITVNNPAAPAITSTQAQLTAAPATAGTAYSFSFVATGSGPLTWSATGLPADALSLGASSGVLSGTPTSKATLSFTLTVSDTFGQSSAPTAFVLTVNNPAVPVITTTQAQVTAAPGTIGMAYTFAFHATGSGTLTWSSTGLPADSLALNSGNGVVSGTPTTKQSVAITLTVSDTFGQSSAATPFTITVNNPAPPIISTTPAQVPGGTVNVAYSFTFHGSGYAPLTWSTTPVLSDSLSINASNGQVSGTPTTAATQTFSVSLTDGVGQVTTVSGFSITVSTESIVFTPSAPSSDTAGGALSVNATVSNDAGAGGVNWSVSCASSPCGGFSASHTASGTATNYTAPPQPPTGGTVTITATAADAPSPQVSAIVTINAAPLEFTTSSLPTGTVNISYNATITASGGVAPYTFTMDASSSALPANLVFNPGSPSATITGTPTATGTTNNIIIDVKDSEATPMTAQMTFSITVNAVSAACGTGSESLLNGQYAMLLQGFDSSGPVGIGATFNADGLGHVATLVGVEDINSTDTAGLQTDLSIISASSSYSVGSDHRGCLTIATSSGSQTFRFALSGITAGIASTGNVIEFDATGSNAAGQFGLQDPSAFATAQISGNFAFGASGPEVGGSKFAIVGMLSLSGGAVGTSSVIDLSDHGNIDGSGTTDYPATPVSLTGGSYTVASNGRGTLTLDTAKGSTGSIIYVLSSTEFLMLTTDSQTTDSLYQGSATQQSGGPYSVSSLSGSSVIYTTGLGNNGGTETSLGTVILFTVTSSGTASVTGWQSSGGSVSAQSASGVTFSVASSGRVTFTVQPGNNQIPIMYLVKPNKGYLLFTDGTNPNPKVESGALKPQSAGPFSTSSLDATLGFGTIQPDVIGIGQEVGIVMFDGAGNASGTSDKNSSGTLKPDQTFTGTYSIASNGLGVIPANCTIGTNCNNVFFLMSPTSLVMLDTSNDTNPDVDIAQQ